MRSLITRRVNQACSLSATELRETSGDNQKEEKRRRGGEIERREERGVRSRVIRRCRKRQRYGEDE